jgi:hypothetical protein
MRLTDKVKHYVLNFVAWILEEKRETLPSELEVRKALLFDMEGVACEDVTDVVARVLEHNRRHIPADFFTVLGGKDSWRLEVRYTQAGAKYRALFYDEDVVFPVYSEEEVETPLSLLQMKTYPLIATISSREDTDGVDGVNVTRRLHKYCGPRKNWYADRGLRLRLQDMFPFDDPETFQDSSLYPYLHIRTIFGVKSYKICTKGFFHPS